MNFENRLRILIKLLTKIHCHVLWTTVYIRLFYTHGFLPHKQGRLLVAILSQECCLKTAINMFYLYMVHDTGYAL